MFRLALELRMTVDEMSQKMPFSEFLKWAEYFGSADEVRADEMNPEQIAAMFGAEVQRGA